MVQVQAQKSHLVVHAFIAFLTGFTMCTLFFVGFFVKTLINHFRSMKDTPVNVPFGGGNNLGD